MIADVVSSIERRSPTTATTPSPGTLLLSPDITEPTAVLLAALTGVTEIQLHDCGRPRGSRAQRASPAQTHCVWCDVSVGEVPESHTSLITIKDVV